MKIPVWNKRGEVVAVTLIDKCDCDFAFERKWFLSSEGYAISKGQLLHRLVMQAVAGTEVDHKNGDRLDNRRRNLRTVDRNAQAQNIASHANSTSRYRNVAWNKHEQKWEVQICLHGKKHFLGRFVDEEEAAEVARAWRREHMEYAVDR